MPASKPRARTQDCPDPDAVAALLAESQRLAALSEHFRLRSRDMSRQLQRSRRRLDAARTRLAEVSRYRWRTSPA